MIEIMSTLTDLLLAMQSTERAFAPGEFVFHQGDDVRAVHLVREGAVNLVRHQPDGAALVLQRAAAGSVLAEASIFSARYHCDAVAVAPSVTRSIRKSAIRSRLAGNRAFAEAWLTHLAREVQAARTRAEILSLRTVAERLDAWIAAGGGRVPARGEWKTVAAEIGTSPEALYRELAQRR
jgi:CRP/FNR family transcriptional regulator, dissimilatory nitrate respiration regulator